MLELGAVVGVSVARGHRRGIEGWGVSYSEGRAYRKRAGGVDGIPSRRAAAGSGILIAHTTDDLGTAGGVRKCRRKPPLPRRTNNLNLRF